MALTKLKIAVFAPMPSASVSTATVVKPGFFSNWRKANLGSFIFTVLNLRLTRGGNTKSQTTSSREIPNFKFQNLQQARRLGALNLGLLWCLEIGFWCFHSYL